MLPIGILLLPVRVMLLPVRVTLLPVSILLLLLNILLLPGKMMYARVRTIGLLFFTSKVKWVKP